jgi:hypothetical protein
MSNDLYEWKDRVTLKTDFSKKERLQDQLLSWGVMPPAPLWAGGVRRPSVRSVTHLTGCLYWQSFPDAPVIPGPLGIWGQKKRR